VCGFLRLLREKLDEINWALEGSCNDIDCNKYMYKDLIKKKFKPVLEHNYSCMSKLKGEKEAVMRLLSQSKFRELRYKKCKVCKKNLDKLSDKNNIVSFTKEIKHNQETSYQWEGVG